MVTRVILCRFLCKSLENHRFLHRPINGSAEEHERPERQLAYSRSAARCAASRAPAVASSEREPGKGAGEALRIARAFLSR